MLSDDVEFEVGSFTDLHQSPETTGWPQKVSHYQIIKISH